MIIVRLSVLFCLISVFGSGDSFRGFYCRDPDTGTFHSINSTWASTTFCGNYSCQLRFTKTGDNNTETKIIELNDVLLDKETFNNDNANNTNTKNEKAVVIEEQKIKDADLTAHSTDFVETILKQSDDVTTQKSETTTKNLTSTDDGSSYLNEKEIKSLTDIIRTMKKGDVEAILEIYDMAKNIHNEIDKNKFKAENEIKLRTDKVKTKSENQELFSKIDEIVIHNHGTLKNTHSNINNIPNNDVKYSQITMPQENFNVNSYWYDPVSQPKQDLKSHVDLDHEGSNSIPAVEHPAIQEFKQPFYYPVSSFQRQSSYVHYPTHTLNPNQFVQPQALPITVDQHVESKPQNTGVQAQNVGSTAYPWVNQVIHKPCHASYYHQHPQHLPLSQQPALLLPYPFSMIHHYNLSYPQNLLTNSNPWGQIYMDAKRTVAFPQSYLNNIPGRVVYVNSNVKSENEVTDKPEQSKVEKVVDESKSRILKALLPLHKQPEAKSETKLAPWQTESLSPQVLEEVRANIQEKSENLLKAFPIRKKIKLEKVGQVKKVDETRVKRDTSDKDEQGFYEAVVVQIKCETDTEPGYFHVGNLTAPYPACCPQRIQDGVTGKPFNRKLPPSQNPHGIV